MRTFHGLPVLAEERADIVRHAQRLRPDRLVVATSGNLSVRRGDLVAITPSGLDYDDLRPELVTVVSMDGTLVEGELAPSTELPLHLAAYRATTARAVVHTHSLSATVVACTEEELPPVHYLFGEMGGPVRVAPYAGFGTAALAAGLAGALEGRTAALLRSHGAVTVGETLERAYSRALVLEWLAALWLRAAAHGTPRLLTDEELAEAVAGMGAYGDASPR